MEPAPPPQEERDPEDDLAGQTVRSEAGAFEVERRLAHGGMGSVWLAKALTDGATVVVKVPHAVFLDKKAFLTRFAREIQRLQVLEHPHVLRILAHGEHRGRPFLVLPYLAGGSLEDRLRALPGLRMPAAECLGWLLPIAATLDHVHARGVVHRDVKPGNILFEGDGTAVLSDFGIARSLAGGETSLTSTGVGVGSPDHVAPEQATGAEVTGRADQYGLASTLFQALAGRPPFLADTPLAVLVRKQMDLAPTVSQALPALEGAAGLALVRALAKDPEARFSSCVAFATAFARGLHGEAPPPAPPATWSRHRALLLVGALLLGTLVAASWLLRNPGGDDEGTPAVVAPVLAPEQHAEAARLGIPAWFDNALGMRFVLIPAGTFPRGSPPGEPGHVSTEAPHQVTLTRAYYLQTTEVTNAQFRRFRPTHESGRVSGRSLDGDRQPATLLHHVDALDFARWVGEQDPAHTYRLPTEAEWERAARAGTTTWWWWGNDITALPRYANFGDRQGYRLAGFGNAAVLMDDGFAVSSPVGSFQANPWGLYDILGNVWECCSDFYAPYPKSPVTDPRGPRQGSTRVYRGSGYRHVPEMERPSVRFFSDPTHALDDGGIRLAADVPGP